MAKKQTFTLDFTPDFDFDVIAIYCAYRDYKLCAEINQVLDFSLEKKPDLELKSVKKGSTSYFPYFSFLTEDAEEIYLLSNKTSQHLFIAELKQVDFFLVIKNKNKYTDINQIIKKINTVKIINSSQEINLNELKSADHFLILEPSNDPDDKLPLLPPIK